MTWIPYKGAEWLSYTDAAIAGLITKSISASEHSTRVLEIGVFKGAWSFAVMMNDPKALMVGVDPYPYGYENAHHILLRQLKKYKITDRFQLFDTLEKVNGEFDIIHIDGSHEEIDFSKDLDFSMKFLEKNGLLVVDDVRHRSFPGLTRVLMEKISDSDFDLVLDSGQKMYFCHERRGEQLKQTIEKAFSESRLRVTTRVHPNIAKNGKQMTFKGKSFLVATPKSRLRSRIHGFVASRVLS